MAEIPKYSSTFVINRYKCFAEEEDAAMESYGLGAGLTTPALLNIPGPHSIRKPEKQGATSNTPNVTSQGGNPLEIISTEEEE